MSNLDNLISRLMESVSGNNETRSRKFVNTSAESTAKLKQMLKKREQISGVSGEIIMVATDEDWGIIKLTVFDQPIHVIAILDSKKEGEPEWEFLASAAVFDRYATVPGQVDYWLNSQLGWIAGVLSEKKYYWMSPEHCVGFFSTDRPLSLDPKKPTDMKTFQQYYNFLVYESNLGRTAERDVAARSACYNVVSVVAPAILRCSHSISLSQVAQALLNWATCEKGDKFLSEIKTRVSDLVLQTYKLPPLPVNDDFGVMIREQTTAIIQEAIARIPAGQLSQDEMYQSAAGLKFLMLGSFRNILWKMDMLSQRGSEYREAFDFDEMMGGLREHGTNPLFGYRIIDQLFSTDMFFDHTATPDELVCWNAIAKWSRIHLLWGMTLTPEQACFVGYTTLHPNLQDSLKSEVETVIADCLSKIAISQPFSERNGMLEVGGKARALEYEELTNFISRENIPLTNTEPDQLELVLQSFYLSPKSYSLADHISQRLSIGE